VSTLEYLRLAGVDDGFFPQHYKELKLRTVLVGTLYRGRELVDLKLGSVTVDGSDGTERVLEILRAFRKVDVVFLDGVTLAGFNVVDPEALLEASTAVVVMYKFQPKLEKVEAALRKHFPDWQVRFNIIRRTYERSQVIATKWKPVRVAYIGSTVEDLGRLISYLQLVSSIPEPLRVADLIASAVSRNEKFLRYLNRMGGPSSP
jgi:endonuclease V-like protein UPF0215 family